MWYIVFIIVGIVVIIASVLLIIYFNKKMPKGPKINDEFISSLINYLGGKDNINSAKNINGRVSINIKNLELPKFEELKKLSSRGVFVTNNDVKMLFSYDSNQICKNIESKIKGA